jgi:hypothetical protein
VEASIGGRGTIEWEGGASLTCLLAGPTRRKQLTMEVGRNGTRNTKVQVNDKEVRTNFLVSHRSPPTFLVAYSLRFPIRSRFGQDLSQTLGI